MKLTTALRTITIAASTAAIGLVPTAGAQAHAAPASDAQAHAAPAADTPGYSGYTPEEAAFLKTVEVKGSPGGVPSGSDGPIQRIFYTASSYATSHPGTNPPGANNFSCKPKKGQNPVVLLPGTKSDGYVSWSMYTPQLRARGYCPFVANFNGLPWLSSVDYTGDIRKSAKATSIFINRVLRETGSKKVDIIGWSQGGGSQPNYYIQKLGGDKKVGKMIGIAPANHGVGGPAISKWINEALPDETHTSIEDAAKSVHMASYPQQLASSQLMKELYHSGKVTRPGVKYINIEGKYDYVVAPYTNAFIREPGVKNITVQDTCPQDHATHVNFPYDTNVAQMVFNALDPDNTKPVKCKPQPFIG